MQDDVYRDHLQNPAIVRGHLRELDLFQTWSMGISSPISILRELDVAAVLRGQSSRGRSVPARLIHSLVCFEKVFDFNLFSKSRFVRSQSRPHDKFPPAPPKQTKMVVVRRVADMGLFVKKGPSLPFRCFA